MILNDYIQDFNLRRLKMPEKTLKMRPWKELFPTLNAIIFRFEHTKRRQMTVRVPENCLKVILTVQCWAKSKIQVSINRFFCAGPETSSTLTPYCSLSRRTLYELFPFGTPFHGTLETPQRLKTLILLSFWSVFRSFQCSAKVDFFKWNARWPDCISRWLWAMIYP